MTRFLTLGVAVAGWLWASGCGGDSAAPPAPPSDGPATGDAATAAGIMPLNEVRVGMRGYGLSVFQGTRIQPFAIEVTTVMNDFGPKRGAIWIRCTDPRMQKNGVVQGMSGSPIYIWGPGESQRLGRGGRLIGAFAFGYGLTKDCYVGVQPIEYMRGVAERAAEQNTSAQVAGGRSVPPGTQLRRLLQSARRHGVGAERTWRAAAMLRLLGQDRLGDDAGADHTAALPAGPGGPGRVERLLLPLQVGSASLASAVAPLLEPSGLAPLAAPEGVRTGAPPPGVDIDAVRFEPGSVLAVPMAWGDMDLSASGTVTEVLSDGRVLAFGHAMNSEGTIALPMATGFVHFVVPSIQTSFKLGGSGVIRGGLVRDEAVGIVGTPTGTFSSAPMSVAVRVPGQPQHDYQYHIAHDRALTPVLAAILAMESLGAAQGPPPDNTLRIRATMAFAGGHELKLDLLQPNASEFDLLMSLMPPIDTMVNNSYASAQLHAIDVTMDMEPTQRFGALVNARLDRARVTPGQTLGLTLSIQPYRQPQRDDRIEFTIPEDLPDGDYPLMIADARTYLQFLMNSRPHLQNVTDIVELRQAVQQILAVREDAFYLMLQLPTAELALGRQEWPKLPSSRKALIATPLSTRATPYRHNIEKIVPMDLVTAGSHRFMVTVDRTLTPAP